MLKAFAPLFKRFKRKPRDRMLWSLKLQRHRSGKFSMAVVQGNNRLEDQSQVFTSNSYTMVGIFDGHGGSETSRMANNFLILRLNEIAHAGAGMSRDAILAAFRETEDAFYDFVRTSDLVAQPRLKEVGTCCIVGAISNGVLYVANLGDSRAVLGHINPNPATRLLYPVAAERLTTDHNVADIQVRNEVIAQHPDIPNVVSFANGSYRVMGIIQVSRSIGDFHLKIPAMRRPDVQFERPVLSSVPEVIERQMTPADKFVIFASDGFWELLTDQAAVDIVANNKKSGIAKRLIRAALFEATRRFGATYEELVEHVIGGRRNVHDDISVVVLFLDHRTRVTHGAAIKAPIDIFTHNAPRL